MVPNLLSIDDDKMILRLIELTVKRHNFAKNVRTLSDGEEGVEYFENEVKTQAAPVPELIFLDLNMSAMNGWEFMDIYAERYQKLYPETKVCILTSSIDPRDERKAKDYPCIIDFVFKPLTKENLALLANHDSLRHFFE
jgi:CheY-like chemotaxis protein